MVYRDIKLMNMLVSWLGYIAMNITYYVYLSYAAADTEKHSSCLSNRYGFGQAENKQLYHNKNESYRHTLLFRSWNLLWRNGNAIKHLEVWCGNDRIKCAWGELKHHNELVINMMSKKISSTVHLTPPVKKSMIVVWYMSQRKGNQWGYFFTKKYPKLTHYRYTTRQQALLYFVINFLKHVLTSDTIVMHHQD